MAGTEVIVKLTRRALLEVGWAVPAAAAAGPAAAQQRAEPASRSKSPPDAVGVLVDTTLCIGCRKCEEACNRRNRLPRPERPFTDRRVFRAFRRPDVDALTVVNQFHGSPSPDQSEQSRTYAKMQCMHCLWPSCVSACIVGAMQKAADGAVVYDPTICIGCRYCMVACPFEIPAYEYRDPVKPRVRKCEMCTDVAAGTGANPACAAACPTEALVFGKRVDLLLMAKERIAKRPDRYLPHIYGEEEVGGTSWLYLTGRPPREVGLLALPTDPPPRRTEAIQHGIFKYGAIPVAFYAGLAGLMWFNWRRAVAEERQTEGKTVAEDKSGDGGTGEGTADEA